MATNQKSILDELDRAARIVKSVADRAAAFYAEHGGTAAENVMACLDTATKEIAECLEFYAPDLDMLFAEYGG